MPVYEYHCKGACDTVVEVVQRMADNALTSCPECGSVEFSRIITGGTGVIFKGTDWPGKVVSMDVEDEKLRGLSRKVKALKAEGKLPMDAVIPTQDATKDRDGYSKAYPERPELHPKNVYSSE